jgi:hypothetical protein
VKAPQDLTLDRGARHRAFAAMLAIDIPSAYVICGAGRCSVQ